MKYKIALEVATRIWSDPDYKYKLYPDLVRVIAAMLKIEADNQEYKNGTKETYLDEWSEK